MKTRLLFSLVLLALAFTSVSSWAATTYTWTGIADSNWNNSANWLPSTGYPGSATNDVAQIGAAVYAGANPTLNISVTIKTLTIGSATPVTLTISNVLTVNNTTTVGSGSVIITSAVFNTNILAVTGSTFTFGAQVNIASNGNALTFGGGISVINNTSSLINIPNGNLLINGGSTVTLGAPTNVQNGSVSTTGATDCTLNLNAALTSGSVSINNGSTLISNSSGTINSGSLSLTTCAITLAAPINISGDLTIKGNNINTITANATGNILNTITFAAGSSTLNFNGTGTTTVSGLLSTSIKSNLNIGAGNTISFSSISMTAGVGTTIAQLTTITNNGTTTVSGAVAMPDFTNIINSPGAVFTFNNSASVILSGMSSNISNAGTFYAGTSGSPCTITLSGLSAVLSNSGTFYLGSTSIIYPNSSTTSVINSGTFTLQSDQSGSAVIGAGISTSCTGSFNVQRYVTGNRGYRLLTSPVYETVGANNVYSINYLKNTSFLTGTTGIGGGFDKGGNPTLYLYRENMATSNASFTSGNFRGINDITTDPAYSIDGDAGSFNIPAGSGLLFFFRGDRNATGQDLNSETTTSYIPTSATFTATGMLNQGNISVKEWYGASDLKSTNTGYTLVGNPYACSINLDSYGTGIICANILPTVYILNPINKQYATYNLLNPLLGTNGATNIVASGQAFFVQADPVASSASFTFTEAAKLSAAQQSVGGGNLMMGTPQGPYAVRQLLRLKLSLDSFNYDDIVIGFNSNSSAKYNNMEDSEYLAGMSAPEGLASFSTDSVPVPLSINFLPLPKKTQQVIRLKVEATNSGPFTLKRMQLDSLPKIYEIWLMDRYKKDSLDLRNNTNYAFEVNKSDTGSFGNNRFQIVVRQNKALGVHLLNFTAVKAANSVPITWKTENEENYTNFTVERSTDNGLTFDVLGGFASNSQHIYTFLDANPVKTVDLYRLKLEDLDGVISYSKVITIIYDASKLPVAGIKVNVYPNPSSDMINLAINQVNSTPATLSGIQSLNLASSLASAQKQSYAIKIISITGSIIKTAVSSTTTWQDNVSNLSPGTYFIQVVNNNDNSLVGKSSFVKL